MQGVGPAGYMDRPPPPEGGCASSATNRMWLKGNKLGRRSGYWIETMSAMGHKQTFAVRRAMSALHPIATAKANFRKNSCLLCPRKRTCAVQLEMSALGQ